LAVEPGFVVDLHRLDGWVHLQVGPYDALRGPLGVLSYLAFVPLFWLVPARWSAGLIIVTSLVASIATVGLGYTLLLSGLVVFCYMVVVAFARPGLGPDGRRRLVLAGAAAMLVPYAYALLDPQLAWLCPQLLPALPDPYLDPAHPTEPKYFYWQWAGLGYVILKSLHVLVDAAKGRIASVRFKDFLAFLLFAPTLRMGPILRYQEFVPQFARCAEQRNARSLGAGLIRIAIGLGRLAVLVSVLDRLVWYPQIYFEPASLERWQLILSVYVQPIRIFMWISGYVDIAIGIGLLCGFVVPENFRYPWISTSIREFWRRWHITLGAWLRDYIYIPLGGNRRHVWLNYLLTFLFCGVWHGLYPSYLFWGLSQGIGLSINRAWRNYWDRHRAENSRFYQALRRLCLGDRVLGRILAWLVTFHYQVLTIAWFMDEPFAGARFLPALVGLKSLA